MLQELITYAIILLSVIYVIFSFFKLLKRKKKNSNLKKCNHACDGCSLTQRV